jgi:hypothetical protein
MKYLLLLILFSCVGTHAQGLYQRGESFAFIGPMFHFNFGGGEHHFSIALEASYWKDVFVNSNAPLMGVDVGIEYEFGGKFRIYGEGQTGGILGLSAGPVLEFKNGESTIGFQSSLWYAFILGVDMRWRYTDKNYWAPGVFGKVPLPLWKAFPNS